MTRLVATTLTLTLTLTLLSCGNDESSGLPGEATVKRVVDGDTLVARLDGKSERIRLIGVDAPESVAEDQPIECYGPEASDHLAELLPPDTEIRLERDVEARDRYHRLLAYVYRSSDDLFVNREIVAGGFAEARSYPPNTTFQADLQAAQSAARTARLGLWGACQSRR